MSKLNPRLEFDNIIQLIQEARSRAFSKVNAELVLLYFNVGKIVSSKVADGIWGEGIKERYNSRELERALNTAQFERVMLSIPIVPAVRTQLPQNLFKDPYIFEFLDLPDTHSETDLEKRILLCKGKDTEVVEYAMARNTSPAMIADYETKLIPKKVLANKLHQLVEQLSKEDNQLMKKQL